MQTEHKYKVQNSKCAYAQLLCPASDSKCNVSFDFISTANNMLHCAGFQVQLATHKVALKNKTPS